MLKFENKPKISFYVENENMEKKICELFKNCNDINPEYTKDCRACNGDIVVCTHDSQIELFQNSKKDIFLLNFDKTCHGKYTKVYNFKHNENQKLPYPLNIKKYGLNVNMDKRKNVILLIGDTQDSFYSILSSNLDESIEILELKSSDINSLSDDELCDLYNSARSLICFDEKFFEHILNASLCGVLPIVSFDLPVAKLIKLNDDPYLCADKINYLNLDKRFNEEVAKLNIQVLIQHDANKIGKKIADDLYSHIVRKKGYIFT